MNSAKLLIRGNDIKEPNGNTILLIRGNAIKKPNGNTILVIRGNAIKKPNGNTILLIRGNDIKEPNGNTILVIRGNDIKKPNGNTILQIRNNEIIKRGDVPIGTDEMIAALVAAGKINKSGGGSGKGGCFIATATMGDYDHPVVKELREFRDQYLLESDWGKKFTKYYYKFGPYPAKVISKSNLLQKLSYVFIVKPLSFVVQKIMNHKK